MAGEEEELHLHPCGISCTGPEMDEELLDTPILCTACNEWLHGIAAWARHANRWKHIFNTKWFAKEDREVVRGEGSEAMAGHDEEVPEGEHMRLRQGELPILPPLNPFVDEATGVLPLWAQDDQEMLKNYKRGVNNTRPASVARSLPVRRPPDEVVGRTGKPDMEHPFRGLAGDME